MALGRPLVAIDLPGHGHSDGGREGIIGLEANAVLAGKLDQEATKAKKVSRVLKAIKETKVMLGPRDLKVKKAIKVKKAPAAKEELRAIKGIQDRKDPKVKKGIRGIKAT